MSRYPRLMPTQPSLFAGEVVRSERISPSFQRVTIAGPELAGFEWLGFDHWFRLFLPTGPQLVLPTVKGRSWYRSYLLIGSAERPHCSNYTVAGFRPSGGGGELDIDVVLHWHDGELGGPVARWADGAQPGSPVGFLDQGVMFDPPQDAGSYLLASDETGVPGIRGILGSLPADAAGVALLEVPDAGDVADIAAPSGMDVRWLARRDTHATPGQLALAELAQLTPRPDAYAYVVGESGLATGGRRALKKAGLATSRITFSGFWKA